MYGDGGFYFLQPVSPWATYGGIESMMTPVVRKVSYSGGQEFHFTNTETGEKYAVEGSNRPRPKKSTRNAARPQFRTSPSQSPRTSPPQKFTLKPRQSSPAVAPDKQLPQSDMVVPEYMQEQLPGSTPGDVPYFTTYETEGASEKSAASFQPSSGGVMQFLSDNKVAVGVAAAGFAVAGYFWYQSRKGKK